MVYILSVRLINFALLTSINLFALKELILFNSWLLTLFKIATSGSYDVRLAIIYWNTVYWYTTSLDVYEVYVY